MATPDDRYFDLLDKSGDVYRRYRDRVADDQAKAAREKGEFLGNALSGTTNAVMKGADWSMNRATQEQKMRLADAEAKRADQELGYKGAEEGRKAEKWGLERPEMEARNLESADERAFNEAQATEDAARGAGIEYQPGLRNIDVQRRAKIYALGNDDRKLKSAREIAELNERGASGRNASTIAAGDRHHADQMAWNREKETADLERARLAEQNKPSTADQLGSANFGRKAQDAHDIINQLEGAGYDPSDKWRKIRTTKNPLTGDTLGATVQDSQYSAAQKAYLAAILRKESGGAITPDEFQEYGSIYFPQPGEGPEVRAQKAAKRKADADALILMAGNKAAGQIPNSPYRVPPIGAPRESGTAIAAPTVGKDGPSKTVVKQYRNKTTGKVRTVYSDGTEEISP